ncbi:hypothetical protein FACS1894109_02420 [Spirochaetia bacterium]|nr:hypothetical protein FACS1894109_02420 [Spirochaetia bacterium]
MKTIVKLLILLIIAPHVFAEPSAADEKADAVFPWQLYHNDNRSFTRIPFKVFDDNGDFIQNQNRSNEVVPVKSETSLLGGLLLLAGYAALWGDYYVNPNNHRYLNDEWNRKMEEDKLLQLINRDFNR